MKSPFESCDEQTPALGFYKQQIFSILLLSLTAIGMFLVVDLSGCLETGTIPSAGEPFEKSSAPGEPETPERGAEGADFVLFLSGNWDGQLGPCGCTEHQLGGIDRRSHILNAIPAARRLLLDAGPLIAQEGRQAELKLETFIYSMQQLGYDALALTGAEIIMLQEKLAMDPAVRPPIIATNMPETARLMYGTVLFFAKTLKKDEETIDCLVLAALDPASMMNRWGAEKLQIQEPVSAIKEALVRQQIDPESSSNDKLIITLLPDDNEFLVRQMRQIPALDLVVRVGYGDMPERAHNSDDLPEVATTGLWGKYITRFKLGAGTEANMKGAQFEPIAIEEYFDLDPKIVAILNTYQLYLETENLIEKIPRRALPEADNWFTGSKACADCHEAIYNVWKDFGHAHAMETLTEINRQYDPECVRCHVVGMDYENGYRSMEATPQFAEVGCEMCHGPGLKHRENKYSMYQEIFITCEDCHTTHNSPPFHEEREEYFEKIRHWQEPRIYWKD